MVYSVRSSSAIEAFHQPFLVSDYHKHAEHIVDTLKMCAQCYSKANHQPNTVQYASEALQYDRTDTIALMCRAKAFEKDG